MDTRLMQQIKDILKEFPQYWNGEELQRPIVIDDLKNYDALLISALLKNQKIRENYSIKLEMSLFLKCKNLLIFYDTKTIGQIAILNIQIRLDYQVRGNIFNIILMSC